MESPASPNPCKIIDIDVSPVIIETPLQQLERHRDETIALHSWTHIARALYWGGSWLGNVWHCIALALLPAVVAMTKHLEDVRSGWSPLVTFGIMALVLPLFLTLRKTAFGFLTCLAKATGGTFYAGATAGEAAALKADAMARLKRRNEHADTWNEWLLREQIVKLATKAQKSGSLKLVPRFGGNQALQMAALMWIIFSVMMLLAWTRRPVATTKTVQVPEVRQDSQAHGNSLLRAAGIVDASEPSRDEAQYL